MAVGSYTAITLLQALNQLAARLLDPSFVRWSSPERTVYLQQALRTWNALTGFYRGQGSFTTQPGEPFYSLPSVLAALRAQTYTDANAIDQVILHLLEPVPVGGVWVGTSQFTLTQVIDAVQKARDEFLLKTGVVHTRSTMTVDPVPA